MAIAPDRRRRAEAADCVGAHPRQARESGDRSRARRDAALQLGRRECDRRLVVNVADYEQIREDPLLFIVVPGHEDEQVEDVVEGDRREYLIVRKRGDAADEAERSDPR